MKSFLTLIFHLVCLQLCIGQHSNSVLVRKVKTQQSIYKNYENKSFFSDREYIYSTTFLGDFFREKAIIDVNGGSQFSIRNKSKIRKAWKIRTNLKRFEQSLKIKELNYLGTLIFQNGFFNNEILSIKIEGFELVNKKLSSNAKYSPVSLGLQLYIKDTISYCKIVSIDAKYQISEEKVIRLRNVDLAKDLFGIKIEVKQGTSSYNKKIFLRELCFFNKINSDFSFINGDIFVR